MSPAPKQQLKKQVEAREVVRRKVSQHDVIKEALTETIQSQSEYEQKKNSSTKLNELAS